MIESASSMRAIWSPTVGQSSPTGHLVERLAGADPQERRPGNSRSSVIHAWAISTGWIARAGRGHAGADRQRCRRLAGAPSHGHVWPDSPGSHQGCRWSEEEMPSKPACSAATAWRSSSSGGNSSWEIPMK